MGTELFGPHLVANPRGREYSYLVTMTGCPLAWSDGKAVWTAPGGETVLRGGLGSTDWTFDLTADPLSPLDIGGGLTVELVDEPTRATRLFFAPNYDGGGYTRLSATATAIGATLTVFDTAPFSPLDTVHCGQESMLITAINSATELAANRAAWGSRLGEHAVYNGGLAVAGPRVSLSPREHRGRILSIWLSPIQDDGTLSTADADMYKVWAGRVASVSFDGGSIKIACDSLLAPITKDDWPRDLPAGSFGDDHTTFRFTNEQLNLRIRAKEDGATSWQERASSRLGYFASGDSWTLLGSADGATFTLAQIARYLTDSVTHYIISETFVPVTSDDVTLFKNHFSIGVVDMGGNREDLVGTNSSIVRISLSGPIIEALLWGTGHSGSSLAIYTGRDAVSLTMGEGFQKNGLYLSATANEITYIPESAARPLTINGCYNNGAWTGFARIFSGDNVELVSFTGASAASTEGRRTLTGVTRGLGGTAARAWGNDPSNVENEGGGEKVSIAQVWMEDFGRLYGAQMFILAPLLSTGSYALNSTYDRLGYEMGLGIPQKFVDIDGIVSKIGTLNLPHPRSLWITDAKKGKDDLGSFLQANGLYFVTRRFLSGGENLFGISIDTIEQPSRTAYQDTITDGDRSGNTRVTTSFNERLIVNSVRLAPYWSFNKSAADTGGFHTFYAEESIADYGASKALEIAPAAAYSLLSAGGVADIHSSSDLYAALVTLIGLRWSGAFANGNYVLTLDSPHTGWRFMAGQTVQVSLTGVTASNGDDSLVDIPGRVMSIKQRHGKNPGATVEIRLAYEGMCELAPCMKATAVDGTGTILTIASNEFSSVSQQIPFGSLDGAGHTCFDSYWFDLTEHGGALSVFCWEIGDYANGQEKAVSAITHGGGGSTLTLSSALSAGLQAAATADTLIITFANYATASALSKLFAYIGSNATPSLLNGVDDAPRLA